MAFAEHPYKCPERGGAKHSIEMSGNAPLECAQRLTGWQLGHWRAWVTACVGMMMGQWNGVCWRYSDKQQF